MPIDCNPPEDPGDRLPDSISTPEEDIGADPAASDKGLEVPPGSAPSPYDADKKPKGLEKFVDEVVRGEYM